MERLKKELVKTSQEALKKFGLEHQMKETIEELFQLVGELSLKKCYPDRDKKLVIDEIADVWFTTLQMALVFGFDECVERLEYKMVRLQNMLYGSPDNPDVKEFLAPIKNFHV